VNDSDIWKDAQEEPSELEALVDRGPFDTAVEMELPARPTPPVLVRPLVTEPGAAWVAPVQRVVPTGGRQRIGVTAGDTALAAKLAADAAVWFADHNRRTVVVDGSVVSPVIGKPLPEDGDEGLVDAALFGVSTSLAARRTLASGVTVMTAGSYPVSVEAVLGGEDLTRVLESFADDVLVLLVLPLDSVAMAAHALTGMIVAGESPGDVRSAADRAGLPVARTLTASAAVVSMPPEDGRSVSREEGERSEPAAPGVAHEGLAEQEAPDEAPDRAAVEAARDEGLLREEPEDQSTALEEPGDEEPPEEAPVVEEPRPSEAPDRPGSALGTPAIGSDQPAERPVPGTEPVEPPSVVLAASRASAARPGRRRSLVGLILPLIVVAIAIGWWIMTDGPLAPDGDAVPTRPVDVAATDTGADAAPDELEAGDGRRPAAGSAASEETPTEAPDGRPTATGETGTERVSTDAAEATVEPGASARGTERPTDEAGGTTDDTEGPSGAVDDDDEGSLLIGPGGPYVVYVSSHRRLSLAEREKERVEGRGVPTTIVGVELEESGLWHRLRLPGGYPTLSDARLALDRLSELGYEGAWVEYHPDES